MRNLLKHVKVLKIYFCFVFFFSRKLPQQHQMRQWLRWSECHSLMPDIMSCLRLFCPANHLMHSSVVLLTSAHLAVLSPWGSLLSLYFFAGLPGSWLWRSWARELIWSWLKWRILSCWMSSIILFFLKDFCFCGNSSQ